MKIPYIVILSALLSFNYSTHSMQKRPDPQYLYITDQYIAPIQALVTIKEPKPSEFQKEIQTLMAQDKVYKSLFNDPTCAGLIIKQTCNQKNPETTYTVALMYNTKGSVQWLRDEILKQKNNLQIAQSMGYMMRQLVHYDTDPIATLESIFKLRVFLDEKGQREFLYHKVKAVESAHTLRKKDLVTYLMSH